MSGVFLALESKRHFPSRGSLLRPSPKFSLAVVETCWIDRPMGAKMPPSCPRELRSLALNPGGNLKRALGRDPTGPGKCPQAPRHSVHPSRPTVAHYSVRSMHLEMEMDGTSTLTRRNRPRRPPKGPNPWQQRLQSLSLPLNYSKLAETYREQFQSSPSALVSLVSNEISAAALHQH